MLDIIVQFFGWPAVGLALGLVLVGLSTNRAPLVVLGALAAAPFTLYIGLSPAIGWPMAFAAWLLFLASAEALRRGRRGLAAVGLVPFGLLAGTLLFLVFAQDRSPTNYPANETPSQPRAPGTWSAYPGMPLP